MAADRYIYCEDQAFYSLPIIDLIAERLNGRTPRPKVIFVHGPDPTDPPTDLTVIARNRLFAAVSTSIANECIAYYRRWDRTIHSKVTIIDDIWALIGSANSMRRSLYTDGELSIAVIDEAATSNPPAGFARDLRVALWWEHCGYPGRTSADLHPLDEALGIWDSHWGTPVFDAMLNTGLFTRMHLEPGPGFNVNAYDVEDPDSRQLF